VESRSREGGSSQSFKYRIPVQVDMTLPRSFFSRAIVRWQISKAISAVALDSMRNSPPRRDSGLPWMCVAVGQSVWRTEHNITSACREILAQLLQERSDLAGGCWHGDLRFR